MKTIPKEVKYRDELPECWLAVGESFFYLGKYENLPTIEEKYVRLLVQLNIPFVFQEKELQFWDPEVYEEVDCCLPTYQKLEGKYRYIGMHTEKRLSEDTIKAAIAFKEQKVEPQKVVFEEQCKQKSLFKGLKHCLAGSEAVGIEYTAYSSFQQINWFLYEDIIFNEEHIIVFPVYSLISEERREKLESRLDVKLSKEECQLDTDYLVIFDKTKIQGKAVVKLEVPLGMKGLFIGRKGWQLKKWCEKLNVKRIDIEEVL